jgi:hypothetical protein
MRILLWHVHGSWTDAFVRGRHTYLLPLDATRSPNGRGRGLTWDWPAAAREVAVPDLATQEIDLVVLQRPGEVDLCLAWTGRRPGRDIPAVWIEHNTPRGDVPLTRHPVADLPGVVLVHVTHFNDLFWDACGAERVVIEHGILDPGARWTGELARAGVVVNEPVRRGRVTGTDLLAGFAAQVPLDVFGMQVRGLPAVPGLRELPAGALTVHEDLPRSAMHAELARRRVYVHPLRWTSLGLSLIEAMHLGMPVVALATTEAVEAVPPEAGVISTRPDVLHAAARRFVDDRDWAHQTGKAARAAALTRYGLNRFLADWDRLLAEVTR